LDNIVPRRRAEEVNKLLLDKWGISLFKFAQVFALSPAHFLLQKQTTVTSKEIKEVKDILKNMRKDILKKTRHIDTIITGFNVTDNLLMKHSDIEGFINGYIRSRELLLTLIELPRYMGIRGGGLSNKTIIALGWGNLISHAGGRISWQILAGLYSWLWKKIKDYGAYTEWEWTPTAGIEDDLKVQYHRYRFEGSLTDYAMDHSLIPDSWDKDEDWAPWMRFLITKSANGKTSDYETFKVVCNMVTDWFLAGSEGLTIFSPSGSFADPHFHYLYSLLRDKVNNARLPPAPKLMPSIEKAVSSYKALMTALRARPTEIDEYFLYAADIYFDRKADLKNLPPMIIFPNRTYFIAST
jgi:hypothetical protein